MTDLVKLVLQDGKRVVVFPIHEHWTDIGTPADLERARAMVASWGTSGS